MAGQARVSVVVPVYNAERFLARAIDSVLCQDSGIVKEILLVDNNSTDGSATIIDRYRQRHPQFIRALNCPEQGCNPARNCGLAVATGDWVQFLDADDELLPDKLASQLSAVTPADEWLIGAYRNQFPDGRTANNLPHPDPWKGLVFRYRAGYTCSNLFRRSTLIGIGGWDEALVDGTDPDVHFRLLSAGVAWRIIEGPPKTIYHHHPGPDRVSTGRPVAGNVQRADLLWRVNQYLRVNRSNYFTKNRHYFEGALLRALRILATHDLARATELYDHYFAVGPAYGRIPTQLVAAHWQWLQKWLGFERTEGLRRSVRSLTWPAVRR